MTVLSISMVALADKQVNIVNDSEQPIDFAYTIPAYTSAILRLKKLSVQQLQFELLKAILNDSEDEIYSVVQTGANVNQEIFGKLPLVIALLHDRNKAFEALLNCNADYDIAYEGRKLLLYARCKNKESAACLLVKKGADFYESSGKYDVLENAIISSQLELTKEILKKGYDIQKLCVPAIHCAIERFDACLKLLLKYGLNPNAVLQQGDCYLTPLLIATYYGNEGAIELLLQAGAEVNKGINIKRWSNISGYHTPLSVAVSKGYTKIANLLITHGASI